MNYRKQKCVISKQFAITLYVIDKSMMYIKNNKDSKMDPCGAPVRISAKEEH